MANAYNNPTTQLIALRHLASPVVNYVKTRNHPRVFGKQNVNIPVTAVAIQYAGFFCAITVLGTGSSCLQSTDQA